MEWSELKDGSGCEFYEIITNNIKIFLQKFTYSKTYAVRCVDSFGTVILVERLNFIIDDDETAKNECLKVVKRELNLKANFYFSVANDIILK